MFMDVTLTIWKLQSNYIFPKTSIEFQLLKNQKCVVNTIMLGEWHHALSCSYLNMARSLETVIHGWVGGRGRIKAIVIVTVITGGKSQVKYFWKENIWNLKNGSGFQKLQFD